jgi:hypothetical protein
MSQHAIHALLLQLSKSWIAVFQELSALSGLKVRKMCCPGDAKSEHESLSSNAAELKPMLTSFIQELNAES